MPHADYVIQCLNKFIRYNTRLITLNLSNTGLNGQVLVGIVQGLRHAKGLLCLHLTSNPGLSDSIEEFYRKRLKVVPYEDSLNIEIENENLEKMLPLLDNMSEIEQKMLRRKAKLDREWRVDQVCNYLINNRLKPLMNR